MEHGGADAFFKSTPRVGDIVSVLKPSNTASLGLVCELEHKKKGSETSRAYPARAPLLRVVQGGFAGQPAI